MPKPKSYRKCVSDCVRKYGGKLPYIATAIIIVSLPIAIFDGGATAGSVAAVLFALGYGNVSTSLTTCLLQCLRKKNR